MAIAAHFSRPFDNAAARCAHSEFRYLCEAVDGLGKVREIAAKLPDIPHDRLPPQDVPGAIDPAISQANIDATICRPGYAKSVRPAYAITGPLKRRMMARLHPGEALSDYELDHLIPISLGGALIDNKNLWLQPTGGEANAHDKNRLAYVLWKLVCRHDVLLKTAQDDISKNWILAYRRYATPENVERFHYRGPSDSQE